MKMKDLEQRTGVNRETIRVYFREGLLPEPERPKPNVAVYNEAHVRAVIAIRELQRGRRIPLHQIRRAVDGDASAVPSEAGAFAHLESLVAARVGVDDSLVPLSSVEALSDHAETDALAFEAVGAVRLVRRRGKLHLSRGDAQLIALWGQMRAAGFNETNGFQPEVARIYVEAANALAHAEISEFLSSIMGRVNEAEAAALAQTGLKLMLDFFGLLRMKAVLSEIRDQTSEPPGGRS